MVALSKEIKINCPTTLFFGRRISRMSEKRIETFEFNSQSLTELGSDNIGLLIAGKADKERPIELVRELSEQEVNGNFVVATSSNKLADWCYRDLAGANAKFKRPDVYKHGCITLTTPEKISKVSFSEATKVLGLILLDPAGVVHKARGDSIKGWANNDRPQKLAKFRFKHRKDGWQPPMILVSLNQAKSMNTSQMLGPYSLEAWWFVDLATLRIGPAPQSQNTTDSHSSNDCS